MKRIKLFLVCFLFSANAFAIIPENGWWWNPNESGRGFNLEVQDNLLFFASFAYDLNGNPAWYTAGGPMTSDRDWTATLVLTSRGQCFGCSYVAPTLSAVGTVTLRFTSSQTAILTVNGVSISVQRMDFWLNNTRPDAMLGEWSSVIGAAADIFDGERIDYTDKRSDSTGPYLGGRRLGSSSLAVVSFDTNTGLWTALLDSSTSFYRYFRFAHTGFNRVEGSFWLIQKGSNPTGSGTFFQAFKTASYAFLSSGTGPASSKRIDLNLDGYEERDARLFAWLSRDPKAGEAFDGESEIVSSVRMLEGRLQQLKQIQ